MDQDIEAELAWGSNADWPATLAWEASDSSDFASAGVACMDIFDYEESGDDPHTSAGTIGWVGVGDNVINPDDYSGQLDDWMTTCERLVHF